MFVDHIGQDTIREAADGRTHARKQCRHPMTLGSLPAPQQHHLHPPLENQPGTRRRVFWFGLLVILLFVAGILQFALLDRLAPPAAERVNNGDHATFFAVHINPYYIFSEDFHLYVVRAKRILDRGWTDSPLRHMPNERPNYSAPLQAGLMMLAVQTDGRPLPYSLFICGVLAVAWCTLYVAAARWLSPTFSPLTPLVAVLVTTLFGSIGTMLHSSDDFGQWPAHRGLRMATLAWTNPLVVSVLLAATSLLFQRQRPTGRILFVATVLVILAAADTWAFLLSAACVGMVVGLLGLVAVFGRKTVEGGVRPILAAGVGLSIAAALALAVSHATRGGFEGDVLARAGFGPAWRESKFAVTGTRQFVREVRWRIVLLTAVVLAASTYPGFRIRLAHRCMRMRVRLAWPTPARFYLAALTAIPIVAATLIVAALAQFGMDEYHAFQFVWRYDYMLLFCLVVVVSECLKTMLRTVVDNPRRSTALELALTAAFILSLFVYHNVRIYQFVSRTAAHEFFLTKDEELLRDWLRDWERTHDDYTLATLSHELNYLCAYWTKADLLLPEGFPYHSGLNNKEIEANAAAVLAVYDATSQSWLDFNLHRHVWDQWSWGHSRLLSARHGAMYYLLHRALLVDGQEKGSQLFRDFHTTSELAAHTLEHYENVRTGGYSRFRAGLDSASRIAELLGDVSRRSSEIRPDVIVIDEVSRALGTPRLTGYTRQFQHGSLEAWVRSR